MNRYYEALRTGADSNLNILKLLESDLGATFNIDDSEMSTEWKPGDIAHMLTIIERQDSERYLLYEAVIFQDVRRYTGLPIATRLNSELLGMTFASIPVDNSEVVYCYSWVRLKAESWYLFACFAKHLRRLVGITELVSRQDLIRHELGLPSGYSHLLEEGDSAPIALLTTARIDPSSPRFAVGLWVSEVESRDFHASMARQLSEFTHSSSEYVAPAADSDTQTPIDLRLEASYRHASLRDLKPIGDYNAIVRIEPARHPELGWGVQEIQTFAFFTGEGPGFRGQDQAKFDAAVLANVLNHIGYRNLKIGTGIPPLSWSSGGWVAHNDQIFHGKFFPATTLDDLANSCVGIFGQTLAELMNVRDAVLRAEQLVQYLLSRGESTHREPDPYSDYWAGCKEGDRRHPTLACTELRGHTPQDFEVDFLAPVVCSVATWGTFSVIPVVYSLEIIRNYITGAYSLVRRERTPLESKSILVDGPRGLEDIRAFQEAVERHFGDFDLPRIDWCLIQSRDFDEQVRRGLRAFAEKLSGSFDVGQLTSSVFQASSPWEIYRGAEAENVFDYDKSIGAGFEWVTTLPAVVDTATAQLSEIFLHSKLRHLGENETHLATVQLASEFANQHRRSAIEPATSFEAFLRENYDLDDKAVATLVEAYEVWLRTSTA